MPPRRVSREPRWVVYFDCLTLKICPAIVIVPLRFFGRPVYAATEYVTVPLPLPLAPPVTVIHEALLVAVQAQPASAVTATAPVLPAGPYVARVGEMEYVQGVARTIRLTLPRRSTT